MSTIIISLLYTFIIMFCAALFAPIAVITNDMKFTKFLCIVLVLGLIFVLILGIISLIIYL